MVPINLNERLVRGSKGPLHVEPEELQQAVRRATLMRKAETLKSGFIR
jgi:hypothetical protein